LCIAALQKSFETKEESLKEAASVQDVFMAVAIHYRG